MQSVTSNAVAQQLQIEGFIKTYEVDYGTVSVSANNYFGLPNILSDKYILGYNLKYWSANTGVFSLQIYRAYGTNYPYIIANNGFSVNQLRIIYYYI